MNGNRTRYASTPTYGMQKRGFQKKSVPIRQVSEAPDFSQTPDMPVGIPFQQAAQPQASIPAPPVQIPMGSFQQPSFMSMSTPPVQQPAAAPAQQAPFAAPTYMQSGVPMPPMQSAQQPLPLGNTAPPISGQFAARTQGFVPPNTPPAPPVPPTFTSPAYTPTAQRQTIPPFSGTVQQTPPSFGFPPQQAPVYPPQPPVFTAPNAQQPQPQRPRQHITADQVWSAFLFVLLPVLFIASLLLSGSLGVMRYVFIGFTVVGLGAMWYRQMYTPTMRLVVSMVYVALCIASIALLMQGAADVQQAYSANPQQQTAAQQNNGTEPEAAPVTEYTPEPIPTPTPTISGPSRAEQRLELFMNLWAVNNTSEMINLVQPTWRNGYDNPSQELFYMLANRTPIDFTLEEITGTEQDNSRTVTMRATISKNNNKTPSVYRFMVMMVKEGDEWYVNPNSLATNDQVETQEDENVVNNRNLTGDVTEPPRTTVTPPPPASTTLYFNIGGNYYHMDPQCSSVNADSLPFDTSFAYSELKEVRRANNLSPCLRCGAPTNTLDEAGN